MATIYVKPASVGLRVPGPDGRDLPAAGMIVPKSGFWLRRIADGDVIETTPPTSATAATSTKTTKTTKAATASATSAPAETAATDDAS